MSGSTCSGTSTVAASVDLSCNGHGTPQPYAGSPTGYRCATRFIVLSVSYSCPAGQSLSGTTCTAVSTSTVAGAPVYSCPSGYNLSGSSCSTDGTATMPATAGYSCTSGTLSGASCLGALTRTRYEPYGNTAAGKVPNGIGFTGHVNDPDTGLVYMQQRYYDPLAARFLSTDPVTTDANSGKSFNRYEYAANNPYRYTDPDGRAKSSGGGFGFGWETVADFSDLTVTGGYGVKFNQAAANGNWLSAAGNLAAGTAFGVLNVLTLGEGAALSKAVLTSLESAAAVGARGLSSHGGSFSSSINAAGGEIWTATGKIAQRDFATYVNSGLYRGEVNIISGVHGTSSGATIADLSLFKADAARFGNIPGVNVYNFAEMNFQQISNLLRGPGTTIGGFCDSGACLAPFK